MPMPTDGPTLTAPRSFKRARRRSWALILAVVVAAAVLLPGLFATGSSGTDQAHAAVLLRIGDRELLAQRSRGQRLPRLTLRRKQPPLATLGSPGATVDFTGLKALAGFPFATSNTGSLEIALPRLRGHLGLALEDPEAAADGFAAALRRLEVSYGQPLPLLGNLSARLGSDGTWSASVARRAEDLGLVRGRLDSELDWGLELERRYGSIRGVDPSVTYGATQDGLWASGKLTSPASGPARFAYAVRSAPGSYSPADLRHEGEVGLEAAGGRLSLKANGVYEPRLPVKAFRGEVSGAVKTRICDFLGSMDQDRYRLGCSLPRTQVTAALARSVMPKDGDGLETEAESGFLRGRTKEVELTVGKARAQAILVPNEAPRYKFAVGAAR